MSKLKLSIILDNEFKIELVSHVIINCFFYYFIIRLSFLYGWSYLVNFIMRGEFY